MISLSVTPGNGETMYYNTRASALQTGIQVTNSSILGTLKYRDGYKTFDQDTAKHHLVLSFDSLDPEVTIETKMTGGETVMQDYVEVDDGFCVYSVTDKDEQQIHVKATKGLTVDEKTYSLADLNLEGAPD